MVTIPLGMSLPLRVLLAIDTSLRDANSIPRLATITIDPDTTTKSPGDSFLKTLFILRQE
jgi:hypothetical protein